jgi:hypothetical protein
MQVLQGPSGSSWIVSREFARKSVPNPKKSNDDKISLHNLKTTTTSNQQHQS